MINDDAVKPPGFLYLLYRMRAPCGSCASSYEVQEEPMALKWHKRPAADRINDPQTVSVAIESASVRGLIANQH